MPLGEVDVEVGRDALERVVARAVQRDREGVRVRAEQVGGAVALVDVAVDHQRPLGEVLGAQLAERRDDVVEQAVAAREGAAGVVGAAAEVHGDAALQRVPRRRQRAGHRAPPALDQLGRPGQPEPALLAHAQLAVADAPQQLGVVDALAAPATAPGRSRGSRPARAMPSATTRARSSGYLSIGKRCRAGSGKRQRSCVQSSMWVWMLAWLFQLLPTAPPS